MKNQSKANPHGAYQILDDVLSLVGSFATLGKALATSKMQSTSDAAAGLMQGKVDLPDVRAQLSSAAETLETISDYAIHTDIKQMVDDAGAFARKHPVTALVSVVAVGALLSRLMRRAPEVTKATKRAAPRPRAKKTAARPKRQANGAARTHA